MKTIEFPKLLCSSSQAGLNFEVTVHLRIQIIDPARAVVQGFGNPIDVLMQPVRRIAETIASKFSVDKRTDTKQAIEEETLKIDGDQIIRVTEPSAEVHPDTKALELLRKISEQDLVLRANAAQSKVDKARRDEIVQLLDSPDELLAQTIVSKDDSFRDALNFKLEQYASDRRQQVELLKILIDTKVIEPHDIHERFRGVLDLALEALKPSAKGTPTLLSGGTGDSVTKE